MSKKVVLHYGILITKICQMYFGVAFLLNVYFLKPMGPINTSSENRSNGQTKGAIYPRKKICHPRENDPIGEDDTTLVVGSGVLDQLIARFDALDRIFIFIFAQSTFFSEHLSQLH